MRCNIPDWHIFRRTSNLKITFMKKILLALLICTSMYSASAQTTTTVRHLYWYYPSSNVYYNVVGSDYWYYDEATSAWVEVKTLPATITLEKAPRYTVYYNGKDVWKDNAAHMKKYKVKDNGELKEKKPEKDQKDKQ